MGVGEKGSLPGREPLTSCLRFTERTQVLIHGWVSVFCPLPLFYEDNQCGSRTEHRLLGKAKQKWFWHPAWLIFLEWRWVAFCSLFGGKVHTLAISRNSYFSISSFPWQAIAHSVPLPVRSTATHFCLGQWVNTAAVWSITGKSFALFVWVGHFQFLTISSQRDSPRVDTMVSAPEAK